MLAFGAVEGYREAMRDERGARWLDDLRADVRYAVKMMRRNRGFILAVTLTLGLGISVNGIIFGYVNTILFRPVPAQAPEELVALFSRDTKTGQTGAFGYDDFIDFRDRSGAFAGVAAMTGGPVNLVVPQIAGTAVGDMVWAEIVTEDFFSLLGVRPAVGRFFTAADAPQGGNPFLVLSYDAWQRRFQGDPNVAGRAIRINGSEFVVTGVAPRGFKGMRRLAFWPEVWVPIGMQPVVQPGAPRLLHGRGGGPLLLVGRLRPGFDLERTQAVAGDFARQLEACIPHQILTSALPCCRRRSALKTPQSSSRAFWCSLRARHRRFAHRPADHLRESRGAAAVADRVESSRNRHPALARLLERAPDAATVGRVAAGGRAGGCSRRGGHAPGVAAGALPHAETAVLRRLRANGSHPGDVLHRCDRGRFCRVLRRDSGGARGPIQIGPFLRQRTGPGPLDAGRPSRTRNVLVVSQLALSVILLVAASLFVRSLKMSDTANLGFEPRNRVLVSMNFGLQGYDQARGLRFYDEVLRRTRLLPGVVAATFRTRAILYNVSSRCTTLRRRPWVIPRTEPSSRRRPSWPTSLYRRSAYGSRPAATLRRATMPRRPSS